VRNSGNRAVPFRVRLIIILAGDAKAELPEIACRQGHIESRVLFKDEFLKVGNRGNIGIGPLETCPVRHFPVDVQAHIEPRKLLGSVVNVVFKTKTDTAAPLNAQVLRVADSVGQSNCRRRSEIDVLKLIPFKLFTDKEPEFLIHEVGVAQSQYDFVTGTPLTFLSVAVAPIQVKAVMFTFHFNTPGEAEVKVFRVAAFPAEVEPAFNLPLGKLRTGGHLFGGGWSRGRLGRLNLNQFRRCWCQRGMGQLGNLLIAKKGCRCCLHQRPDRPPVTNFQQALEGTAAFIHDLKPVPAAQEDDAA
jgi:hypothetical protein